MLEPGLNPRGLETSVPAFSENVGNHQLTVSGNHDTFYALGSASYIDGKAQLDVQHVVTSIMNAFAFEIGF